MNGRISLWKASQQIGGNPRLLRWLCQRHGIPIYEKPVEAVSAFYRYIAVTDLARLRALVADWEARPRVCP